MILIFKQPEVKMESAVVFSIVLQQTLLRLGASASSGERVHMQYHGENRTHLGVGRDQLTKGVETSAWLLKWF